jgi:hypothetical protein
MRGLLIFSYGAHEAKALAKESPAKALIVAIVADGRTNCAYARVQRRFRNDAFRARSRREDHPR